MFNMIKQLNGDINSNG